MDLRKQEVLDNNLSLTPVVIFTYLYIRALFKYILKKSDYVACNDTMTSEQSMGKDVKGSWCDLRGTTF